MQSFDYPAYAEDPFPSLISFVDRQKLNQILRELPTEHQQTMQTYLDEAIFFSKIIILDLKKLPPHSRILEIGSGVGWLINYFHALNFQVSGIEPNQSGFNKMTEFQGILNECWLGKKNNKLIDSTAENFTQSEKSDYIYSVNVMEHVQDIELSLKNILFHLSEGGTYRFICPNYKFPYEPHFNFFAPISKGVTFNLHKRKILSSGINLNNQLWDGLNWITPKKVSKSIPVGFKVEFSNSAFTMYLKRIVSSADFRTRKGPLFTFLARIMQKLEARVLPVFPITFLPVLDVQVCAVMTVDK
jgi:SAM-dependent methyltransferase